MVKKVWWTDRQTDWTSHIAAWSQLKKILKMKHKQGKSEGFEIFDRHIVRERPIWVKIGDVLYRVTLKFDGWPWKTIGPSLLRCFKLCASFHSHWWIQTGVTVRKRPIWVKFDDFLSRVTLKFDVWPWKTIGHLYYATSSSMHHFLAIGGFKLELQSGNAQFGSKSTIFFSRVTLQFEVWPWKIIGHLLYATSSFVHHFIAIGDFKLELQSRNAQFGSNSTLFRAVWPCNLMYDLEKQ